MTPNPMGTHTGSTVANDDRPPNSTPLIDLATLARLTDSILAVLAVPEPVELALTLVTSQSIAALNAEYLGGIGPTDVLSFPMDSGDDAELLATGAKMLGDVVICPEVAFANAPSHAGSLEDELALLCVHGVLHILGYDHAEVDDAIAMRAKEAEVLAQVHRPLSVGTEIPS